MIGILKRLSDDLRAVSEPHNGHAADSSLETFYTQQQFFEQAPTLREQLERVVNQSIDNSDGLTPFVYAFAPDAYRFLTATGERVFSREILDDFLDRLRTWAKATLAASFVSTPQLRVYINGCGRALVRDSTDSQWHWMLSLSVRTNRNNADIKILPGAASSDSSAPLTFDRLFSTTLEFNQLLVHPTNSAYSVGTARGSMHPLEGCALLDGYLW